MSLSILCVTRGREEALPYLFEMKDVASAVGAEFVVAADGKIARDVINASGLDPDRTITVFSRGYIESVLDTALTATSGRYVLRLDDDERVSVAMLGWLADRQYEKADHWKFPRAHMWGDRDHYVSSQPLWPDHQTRLSIRDKAGGRQSVHAGSPFGGGVLAACAIEHDRFLVRDRAAREELIRHYDGVAAGAGSHFRSFYVPEFDEGFTVADWPVELEGDELPELDPDKSRPQTPQGWFERVDQRLFPMAQHKSEILAVLKWLVDHFKGRPARVLEIGTHQGGTAALWCELATDLVISLDLPGGNYGGIAPDACKRRNAMLLAKYPHFRGVLADSHSEEALAAVRAILNRKKVDLLFIDADHTVEGVRQDHEMYGPLVKKGGVVLFHDTTDGEFARAHNCHVSDYWSALDDPTKIEFSIDAPSHGWGGLGVVIVGGNR